MSWQKETTVHVGTVASLSFLARADTGLMIWLLDLPSRIFSTKTSGVSPPLDGLRTIVRLFKFRNFSTCFPFPRKSEKTNQASELKKWDRNKTRLLQLERQEGKVSRVAKRCVSPQAG